MAFRKPRYGRNPLAHFKTRDGIAAYREKYGNEKLFRMKSLMRNARTVELDHFSTKRYWQVVWRSLWRPMKVWAFNKQALRYYAAVTSLGLGLAYVRGVRPDLFGLAPRQHFAAPEKVQGDFNDLKRGLGLEDSRIRLVVSRDFSSSEFDHFTEPYVYGSPLLPRGATICVPSVYFDELPGEVDKLSSLQVGKATFDWDTANAAVVKRKLQLPRDELRFLLAAGIVEAEKNMPLRRCVTAPFLYAAGIFTYYGVFWCSSEHCQPAIHRARFRAYEAVWTVLQAAVLMRLVGRQRWAHIGACEDRVAAAFPELAASGANYLDRLAVVRTIIRNQVGHYGTRVISDVGERVHVDWDVIRDTPQRSCLLSRADTLRGLEASEP